jgi:putative NIF3 family GTP cyclohydrolase 1 type 2
MNQSVDPSRREFVSTMTKVAGSSMILSSGIMYEAHSQSKAWTVGDIIDLFISKVPGAPFSQTVDTLKSGSRDLRVTGIVTTMFATVEVIRKAISLKANFIIAHEPTFYNHLDETNWLSDDPVYQYKADLLKKHNIAVWRNHDYIHRLAADGVRAGVVDTMGWAEYVQGANSNVFMLPGQSLMDLIGSVKDKLGVPAVRYIGDPALNIKKVLLMPGASGGRNQITAIRREKPDAVLCGEISEWETAEYVRDARSKGDKIALVVIGHVASEEPGSEFLAHWLAEHVKGVTSTHVPAGNSLMFA